MAKLIMVVNDTQEILEMFRDLLTTEGYEVSLHAYGKWEIDEVRRINATLIIADLPQQQSQRARPWPHRARHPKYCGRTT